MKSIKKSVKASVKKVSRALSVCLRQHAKDAVFSGKNVTLSVEKDIRNGSKTSSVTRSVTVPASLVAQVKRLKKGDMKSFSRLMYPFTRPEKLGTDSASVKLGICKKPSIFVLVCNPLARLIGRDDLIGQYGKNANRINK